MQCNTIDSFTIPASLPQSRSPGHASVGASSEYALLVSIPSAAVLEVVRWQDLCRIQHIFKHAFTPGKEKEKRGG
jgi:hypothetical protein